MELSPGSACKPVDEQSKFLKLRMTNFFLFDKKPLVYTANGRKHRLRHRVGRCIHFVESDGVFYLHSIESAKPYLPASVWDFAQSA